MVGGFEEPLGEEKGGKQQDSCMTLILSHFLAFSGASIVLHVHGGRGRIIDQIP